MDEDVISERIDFIKFAVEHSQELIGLADSKSGIIIGIDGVVLGLMIGSAPTAMITAISASLAVLLFSGSALFAFLTILPRLDEGSMESKIFFKSITKREKEEHISDIQSIDKEAIIADYAQENHLLSGILKKKYEYLRYSSYLLIFAFAPLSFTLLFKFMVQR